MQAVQIVPAVPAPGAIRSGAGSLFSVDPPVRTEPFETAPEKRGLVRANGYGIGRVYGRREVL